MRELRNTKIIAVDHGYGNMKTANTVTPTGIKAYETEPIFTGNILEYNGIYYRIGEGHKEFIPDKAMDEEYYLLTLMAIARELNVFSIREADVHLAAGLPLTWIRNQREAFRSYLLQNPEVHYRFNGKEYHKRYHRKNYQRKVEIYVCKHYKGTYQRYAGYERILRPVVRQLRYFKQVVHKAAHYRAGLVFVKEGEGQLLKMAEHVAPHISLYPYAHDMAPILNYIVQCRLYKIYPKQHARPNQQQPELLIGNIYVGYVFCYHGVKKIAYGDH